MATASSSLADLAYQEEEAYNVLPQTPNLKPFRRISGAPMLNRDSFDSRERRSDRQQADVRSGISRVQGTIEAEMSTASHDDAWQALLGGVWTTGVQYTAGAGTGLTVTAATRTFTRAGGSFITDGFRLGDRVEVAAFDAAYNGQRFTVTGMTATTLTVAPEEGFTFTDVAVADEDATITRLGQTVRNGNIMRSFTMERAWRDIGKFQTYRGIMFSSAAVQLPTTGISTVSWGIMGAGADEILDVSFDGAAPLTATEADLGTITIAGKTMTCATSDWATVGYAEGDTVTIDGVTGITSFPDKQLTIITISGTAATVAEAIPAGTMTAYTINRVGTPQYLAADTTNVLVSVDGAVLVDGEPVAQLTEFNFSIDNQIDGKPVVGSNFIPQLSYGQRQAVSGTVTALFEDETLYNKFRNEQDVAVLVRMDDPAGGFLQFYFHRGRLTSGEIGDDDPIALPLTMQFRALAPNVETGVDQTQVRIQSYAP